ncbi:MAG: hypothetical protein HW402_1074 [Dehalococcoidales bacterium]|nr:hypothetical protein [Dehalococcoidales bacterium]
MNVHMRGYRAGESAVIRDTSYRRSRATAAWISVRCQRVSRWLRKPAGNAAISTEWDRRSPKKNGAG